MVGNKFFNNLWKSPSFEAQVVEIKGDSPPKKEPVCEINVESGGEPELVIAKPKRKPKPTKKKKTATDTHIEIKKLVEKKKIKKAKSVLKKSLKSYPKSKRLQSWALELLGDDDVGSTTKKMWEPTKKKDRKRFTTHN